MIKKLDKLLLKSFVGPFILTFTVAVFILLTQFLLKYFDDFIGKNLGPEVFGQILIYFSVHMTPMALPLAVLLSSIMTFGNLGEHFELTAIKSSGITLTRTLFPIFFFTLLLTGFAMYSNDQIVPRTNIKAWSLLYDVKQKKASLDLKEGIFYSGIPGYSIKVGKKYPDGITLKNVVIYDHTEGQGNNNVILADSGKMFTIMNESYLVFELFNGNNYSESRNTGGRYMSYKEPFSLTRTTFEKSKLVFNLSSFAWERSDETLFANHKYMKTMEELKLDIDTMYWEIDGYKYKLHEDFRRFYKYHAANNWTSDILVDSTMLEGSDSVSSEKEELKVINKKDSVRGLDLRNVSGTPVRSNRSGISQRNRPERTPSISERKTLDIHNATVLQDVDSILSLRKIGDRYLSVALNSARTIKSQVAVQNIQINNKRRSIDNYEVERYKKIAQAVSCLIMFLIGAPLGAIIKKGGLGLPVLISIAFYILFYVLTITGEKLGKDDMVDPLFAVWIPNMTLLPFGLFFLHGARKDSRIFEADFYSLLWMRWKDVLTFKKASNGRENDLLS